MIAGAHRCCRYQDLRCLVNAPRWRVFHTELFPVIGGRLEEPQYAPDRTSGQFALATPGEPEYSYPLRSAGV